MPRAHGTSLPRRNVSAARYTHPSSNSSVASASPVSSVALHGEAPVAPLSLWQATGQEDEQPHLAVPEFTDQGAQLVDGQTRQAFGTVVLRIGHARVVPSPLCGVIRPFAIASRTAAVKAAAAALGAARAACRRAAAQGRAQATAARVRLAQAIAVRAAPAPRRRPVPPRAAAASITFSARSTIIGT